MKYYGNTDFSRMEMIGFYELDRVNNTNYFEGYLNKQGLLFDYTVNADITKKYNKNGYPAVYYENTNLYKRKKYNKEYYYMGVRDGFGGKKNYVVFKELPRITNDKTFKWKENIKYGTKETVIIQGNFEFTCIVKADGDAIVDVRYTKCENKHRNRVTITRIEVYNAANEEILKAIDEWRKLFKKEMDSNETTVTDVRLVG